MDPLDDTVTHPFLVGYAACIIMAIGLRVAIPRGGSQSVAFDIPNIVSAIVLLAGVPLVFASFTGQLQGDLEDLLVVAFAVNAAGWGIAYSGRYHLMSRKRFWLTWTIAVLATPIAGLWSPRPEFPSATVFVLLLSTAPLATATMSSLPSSSSSDDASGGRDGGGGGGE